MKTGPDEFSVVVPWSKIDPDGEYKGLFMMEKIDLIKLID